MRPNRTTIWLAIALGWTLVTVSCSDEPDLEDEGPLVDAGDAAPQRDVASEELIAFQDFADEAVGVACQKAFECCNPSEREEMGLESDEAANCADNGVIGREFGFGIYEDALRDGTVQFDQDLAELCLQSLADRPCSEFSGRVDIFESRGYRGCTELLEATRVDGESCSFNVDCESGYCRQTSSEAKGECQAPPTAGEECPELDCAAAHYCRMAGPTNLCRQKRADGESCSAARECQSGRCRDGQCAARQPLCDQG